MSEAQEGTVSSFDDESVFKRCHAEVYNPETTPWENIGQRIFQLEIDEFGEENGFEEKTLRNDFTNPENTAVILRDTGNGEIVGFTYAQPLLDLVEEDEDEEDDVEDIERLDEGKKTAYIGDTVIDAKYRGNRLVGKMMQTLEGLLKDKGFQFLERHTLLDNKYAENVAKNYEGRVVHTKSPEDSDYGKQQFFRIKL